MIITSNKLLFFRAPKDMYYDEEAAEIDKRREHATQSKPNQSKRNDNDNAIIIVITIRIHQESYCSPFIHECIFF